MGKEEIARNEQFLLFPQCFLLNQIIVSPFVSLYNIISLFAAESEVPKYGIRGKGLIQETMTVLKIHQAWDTNQPPPGFNKVVVTRDLSGKSSALFNKTTRIKTISTISSFSHNVFNV